MCSKKGWLGDVKLLLDCVRCQLDQPSAVTQALLALATLCDANDDAREWMRMSDSLDFLCQLLQSPGDESVQKAAMYTLACVIAGNTHSQRAVCNTALFQRLARVASDYRHSIPTMRSFVFLLMQLVANNGQGQTLLRNTKCLEKLLQLFNCTLPAALEDNLNNLTTETAHTAMDFELWQSVTSTLCIASNNPQNDENQLACVAVFPQALRLLQQRKEPAVVRATASLLATALANNFEVQERLATCSGPEVLVSTLCRFVNRAAGDTEHLQAAMALVTALDAAITDHEENSATAGRSGAIPMLIHLLHVTQSCDTELTNQLVTQVVLTLGHALDICEANQVLLVQSGGMSCLLKLLARTQDLELTAALRYVLQSCVNIDHAVLKKQPSIERDIVGQELSLLRGIMGNASKQVPRRTRDQTPTKDDWNEQFHTRLAELEQRLERAEQSHPSSVTSHEAPVAVSSHRDMTRSNLKLAEEVSVYSSPASAIRISGISKRFERNKQNGSGTEAVGFQAGKKCKDNFSQIDQRSRLLEEGSCLKSRRFITCCPTGQAQGHPELKLHVCRQRQCGGECSNGLTTVGVNVRDRSEDIRCVSCGEISQNPGSMKCTHSNTRPLPVHTSPCNNFASTISEDHGQKHVYPNQKPCCQPDHDASSGCLETNKTEIRRIQSNKNPNAENKDIMETLARLENKLDLVNNSSTFTQQASVATIPGQHGSAATANAGQQVPAATASSGQQVSAVTTNPGQQVSAVTTNPDQQVSAVTTNPGQQVSAVTTNPGQQVSAVTTNPGQQVSAVTTNPGEQVSAVATNPGQHVSAVATNPGQQLSAATAQQVSTVTANAGQAAQQLSAATHSSSQQLSAATVSSGQQLSAARANDGQHMSSATSSTSQQMSDSTLVPGQQISAATANSGQQISDSTFVPSQPKPVNKSDHHLQIQCLQQQLNQERELRAQLEAEAAAARQQLIAQRRREESAAERTRQLAAELERQRQQQQQIDQQVQDEWEASERELKTLAAEKAVKQRELKAIEERLAACRSRNTSIPTPYTHQTCGIHTKTAGKENKKTRPVKNTQEKKREESILSSPLGYVMDGEFKSPMQPVLKRSNVKLTPSRNVKRADPSPRPTSQRHRNTTHERAKSLQASSTLHDRLNLPPDTKELSRDVRKHPRDLFKESDISDELPRVMSIDTSKSTCNNQNMSREAQGYLSEVRLDRSDFVCPPSPASSTVSQFDWLLLQDCQLQSCEKAKRWLSEVDDLELSTLADESWKQSVSILESSGSPGSRLSATSPAPSFDLAALRVKILDGYVCPMVRISPHVMARSVASVSEKGKENHPAVFDDLKTRIRSNAPDIDSNNNACSKSRNLSTLHNKRDEKNITHQARLGRSMQQNNCVLETPLLLIQDSDRTMPATPVKSATSSRLSSLLHTAQQKSEGILGHPKPGKETSTKESQRSKRPSNKTSSDRYEKRLKVECGQGDASFNFSKCPACSATEGVGLDSLTFNARLESSGHACVTHRALRQAERDFHWRQIQRAKQRHRGRLISLRAQQLEEKKRPLEVDVYHFRIEDEEETNNSGDSIQNENVISVVPAPRTRNRSMIQSPGNRSNTSSCNSTFGRRTRVEYSAQEVVNLVHGVRHMGRSWSAILATYEFHLARTAVDLKDKYKGLLKKQKEEDGDEENGSMLSLNSTRAKTPARPRYNSFRSISELGHHPSSTDNNEQRPSPHNQSTTGKRVLKAANPLSVRNDAAPNDGLLDAPKRHTHTSIQSNTSLLHDKTSKSVMGACGDSSKQHASSSTFHYFWQSTPKPQRSTDTHRRLSESPTGSERSVALSMVSQSSGRRAKRPLSMAEERRLLRGVRLFGSSWKKILQSYTFASGRTSEELRQHWRTYTKLHPAELDVHN